MSATVLGLFNTGVDNNGRPINPIGTTTSVDPHYQIITPPPPAQAFACILDPTWIPNTPTAQWISPSPDNKGNQTRYEYQTQFTVQNLSLITQIQITGRWAADDQGFEIRLNGQVQPNVTQCSFRAFASFTIDTGFQNGVNTLVFVVNNALPVTPDPTGLLVQFDAPRITEERFEYEYVAKLVIGKQAEREDMLLARGFYATTINIHNPNYSAVRLYKKLPLTFPPVEEKAGKIYDIAIDTLQPDEAEKVDGNEIRRLLFPAGLPAPGHIEGFVVIQSHASLDVVAVYTTAALDANGVVTEHSAIEVVQVRERYRPTAPPKGKEFKDLKEGKEFGKDFKEKEHLKDIGKDTGKDVKDGGKDGKDISKEEDLKVMTDVTALNAWGDEALGESTGRGGASTFIAPQERPAVGDQILRGNSE